MEYHDRQRRRLAIAAAVTVVLVPGLLLLDRTGADDGVGADPVPDTSAPTLPPEAAVARPHGNASSADDPMGELEPGFVTDESGTNNDGEIPTIVFARPTDALRLDAEYSRSIVAIDRCYVPGAPRDELVTVSNIDNGQLVACYNRALIEGGERAVLNTDAYATIADLTDSPVPVEVTW